MDKALVIFWTVAVILVVATLLLILSEMQLVILERKKKARRTAAKPPQPQQPQPQQRQGDPVTFIPVAIVSQELEEVVEPRIVPVEKKKKQKQKRRRGMVDIPAIAILATLAGSALAGTVAMLPFVAKEKKRKGGAKGKRRVSVLRTRSSERLLRVIR